MASIKLVGRASAVFAFLRVLDDTVLDRELDDYRRIRAWLGRN